MKNVIVYKIGDHFENCKSLEDFVKANTQYKDFQVGESNELEMNEILLEEEYEEIKDFEFIGKIGYNDTYLAHTGINGDDDTTFISIITTVYDEDIDLRYKPLFIMVMPEDSDPSIEYLCKEI